MVIADGNLSANALRDLFERSASAGVDVWFEPTSVPKAIRVVASDAVQFMTHVSPNGDELEALREALVAKTGAVVDYNASFPLPKNSTLSEAQTTMYRNGLITRKSIIDRLTKEECCVPC